MRRFLPPVWVLSAALVLVGVASFAVADRQALHWYVPEEPTPAAAPTPRPDTVVGVQRLCDVLADRLPGRCADIPEEYKRNDRIEVTVRFYSGAGGSYVVTVAPDSTVSVGDTWRSRGWRR